MDKKLLTVSSSPHIRSKVDTRSIMLDVIIAMLPALVVSVVVFGMRALLLTVVSVVACMFFEWGYRKMMKKSSSVGDLSAVVTGMLIAFCMPANAPYWLPVPGALIAIVLVKQLFGGIGKNFVNPALAARAFMLTSWPVYMNTWMAPKATGIMSFTTDVATAATPMGSLNAGLLPEATYLDVFVGNIGGCLGEVSALALLVGFAWLLYRKVISAHIPVSFILTVAVLAFVFPKGGNARVDWMVYSVLSGGVMLGAIFMATDYATSPITKPGQIIYGIGCGALTIVIRYFGAYVEGVSYAILVMNVCAWFIDSKTMPRQFGVSKADLQAAKAKAKEEKKKAKEGVA